MSRADSWAEMNDRRAEAMAERQKETINPSPDKDKLPKQASIERKLRADLDLAYESLRSGEGKNVRLDTAFAAINRAKKGLAALAAAYKQGGLVRKPAGKVSTRIEK